jgi:hypothetical protein
MMGRASQGPLSACFDYCKLLVTGVAGVVGIAAALVIGLSPRPGVSLPLYARQTGQPCATCHTAFLELTPFGRRFQLGGYILGGGDWSGPPFAVMLQPTYTHTRSGKKAAVLRISGPTTTSPCNKSACLPAGRSATMSEHSSGYV